MSTVKIKWTDPPDISTNEPVPCEWAGTVVVRKEGSPPRHRWDGTLIVDSTTRDEYSVNALEDNDVEENKRYYYGIFPYDTRGWYRYTKVVHIHTLAIPEITSITVDGVDVTINFEIPSGNTWSELGIVYKKNSAPVERTDGSTVTVTSAMESVTIQNLSANSVYYFRMYATDATSLQQYLGEVQVAETGESTIISGMFISDYQA